MFPHHQWGVDMIDEAPFPSSSGFMCWLSYKIPTILSIVLEVCTSNGTAPPFFSFLPCLRFIMFLTHSHCILTQNSNLKVLLFRKTKGPWDYCSGSGQRLQPALSIYPCVPVLYNKLTPQQTCNLNLSDFLNSIVACIRMLLISGEWRIYFLVTVYFI